MSTIWNPNTPATLQEELEQTAPKLNANFNTIGDAFESDHNPLGSTTNIGQHNQSTYITQSSVPVADPNNVRLFSQLVGSIPQIFAQYPSVGPYQLTNICTPTSYNLGSFIQVECSLVLNGIIVKIGTLNLNVILNNRTIVYGASIVSPTATPFPTSVFFVNVSPGGGGINPGYIVNNSTPAGFTLTTLTAGVYSYIACGN